MKIDSLTVAVCRALAEMDRLFVGNLDGWLPINEFELDFVRPAKITRETRRARVDVVPGHWPAGSNLIFRLDIHNQCWQATEVRIVALHIHNPAVGGIDTSLEVVNCCGCVSFFPLDANNPARAVIERILVEKRNKR